MVTLIVIGLATIGLGAWLFFLLKPKPKKKKTEDKKKEVKKTEPPRAPEEIERQEKLDEFVTMNPKYATELVRSWLNQKRKRY